MSNGGSSMKLLEADVAAAKIIDGIEKNKFKLFLGSDSKFLRLLYKINSKSAIKFINKKMNINKWFWQKDIKYGIIKSRKRE